MDAKTMDESTTQSGPTTNYTLRYATLWNVRESRATEAGSLPRRINGSSNTDTIRRLI